MSKHNKRQIQNNRVVTYIPPRGIVDEFSYHLAERNTITDTLERLRIHFIPLVTWLTAVETAVARFDQCVIDRGAGMRETLNKLQKRMYDHYSDLEKFCKERDILYMLEDAEPIVMSRTAAYHDYVKGECTYDDLLTLVNIRKDDETLIQSITHIDRGGRPESMKSWRVWLAENWHKVSTQYDPKQYGLADRKKALHLRFERAIENKDLSAQDIATIKGQLKYYEDNKADFGAYMRTLVSQWKRQGKPTVSKTGF